MSRFLPITDSHGRLLGDEAERDSEDRLLTPAPRALWAAWNDFKSVCHLRAALTCARDQGVAVDGWIKPKDLLELLSAACQRAAEAENRYPPVGRNRDARGP